jgi:hypothetical protein
MNESKTPEEQFEADLSAVATHESGHFEVSRVFNVAATMRIIIDDEGNIREGCCWQDFEATAFEKSCISFGGIVAEHLTGHIYRHGPKTVFPLDAHFLPRWHDEVIFHRAELSDSDRAGILSVGGEHTLEACQFCFRTLSRRLRELKEDAALLADKTRVERAAKLADVRERDAAKKLAAEWAANPPKLSTAYRATVLEDYLRNTPADAPERAKFKMMLDCLKRGQEPPAELEKP